jgi:hypothetical protein
MLRVLFTMAIALWLGGGLLSELAAEPQGQKPAAKSRAPQETGSAQSKKPALKPRQLIVGHDCDEAMKILGSTEYDKLDIAPRKEVALARERCAVVERNLKNSNKDAEVVVVTANPGEGDDSKVYYGTLRKSDLPALRRTCKIAAESAFTYLEGAAVASPAVLAVAGADIVTDRGKVQCEAFIRGLEKDNAFVTLAPDKIDGSAVTVRILQMIGQKKAANEVQKEVDERGKEVGQFIQKGLKNPTKFPTIIYKKVSEAAPSPPKPQNICVPKKVDCGKPWRPKRCEVKC